MQESRIKIVKTKEYVIAFDLQQGVEVTSGINGHDDPFVLEYPSLLDVGVMGHCLNKCEFCYQGSGFKSQPNMPLEDFKMLIDQVKDHSMQIALGGRGDPDLHEDFEGLLEYSRKNNIVPNYTTSGRQVDERKAKLTKEYCGVAAVSTYDQPFTYEAIKTFLKEKVKLNLHFVLTRNSFPMALRLFQGEDIWKGKIPLSDINAVVFLLFKQQGNGKDLHHWCVTDEQIKILGEHIRSEKLPCKVGMDSCLSCRLKSQQFLKSKIDQMTVDTCEAGRYSCYVTPDMRFTPCSFVGDDIEKESLKEKSLKEIWDTNSSFQMFRDSLQQNPEKCPLTLGSQI